MNNRRNFLLKAILGAGAFLMKGSSAFGASSSPSKILLPAGNTPNPYVLLKAEDLKELTRNIQGTSRPKNIVNAPDLPYTIRIISEKQNSQKEFEIHAFKDHFVQVLDGTTLFDIGGEAQDARIIGAGEQLAPKVKDYKSVTMQVGDLLVIPRGTPHKRSTTGSAVLLMMSVVAPDPEPAK
jgi:mannose-6-phosphate isomerase-like protein (cupin superfamily)